MWQCPSAIGSDFIKKLKIKNKIKNSRIDKYGRINLVARMGVEYVFRITHHS
jgi:hypothetical protein